MYLTYSHTFYVTITGSILLSKPHEATMFVLQRIRCRKQDDYRYYANIHPIVQIYLFVDVIQWKFNHLPQDEHEIRTTQSKLREIVVVPSHQMFASAELRQTLGDKTNTNIAKQLKMRKQCNMSNSTNLQKPLIPVLNFSFRKRCLVQQFFNCILF